MAELRQAERSHFSPPGSSPEKIGLCGVSWYSAVRKILRSKYAFPAKSSTRFHRTNCATTTARTRSILAKADPPFTAPPAL